MKVQHIQTLVAIAEAGSIRRAAASLGKSQPALTKSLRQAEDALGISLFRRTSLGVVPTALCESVLMRARSIDNELKRLDSEIEQLRGGEKGSVAVCVSPLAAVQIVPRALMQFRRKYASIDVHVSRGLYPNALLPLREGKTDLLIGPTPPNRPHPRDLGRTPA